MPEEKTESCSYKFNVVLCESSVTAKQRGCSAKGVVIWLWGEKIMGNSLVCAGCCQQHGSFWRQAKVTDEPAFIFLNISQFQGFIAFYFCFTRSYHTTKRIALQSPQNPKYLCVIFRWYLETRGLTVSKNKSKHTLACVRNWL